MTEGMGRDVTLDSGQFCILVNKDPHGLRGKWRRVLGEEDIFAFDVVLPDGSDIVFKGDDGIGIGQIHLALFISLSDDPEGMTSEVAVGIFQVTELVDPKTGFEQDFQDGDVPVIQEIGDGGFVVVCSLQYPVHFPEGQYIWKTFRFFHMEMNLKEG